MSIVLLCSLPHAGAGAARGCRGGFQTSSMAGAPWAAELQRQPSRYRGHQGHHGAQMENRTRHEGWLLSLHLLGPRKRKAENQGVMFLWGLCRRQPQSGASLVPIPLPVAVRWLHGTFRSLGALVLVLQELRAGRNKQEEDAATNRGAGNEETLSTGQLRPRHNLGSVLVTAWQGRGCPCFTPASPGPGPSLRAGSGGSGAADPAPR